MNCVKCSDHLLNLKEIFGKVGMVYSNCVLKLLCVTEFKVFLQNYYYVNLFTRVNCKKIS